MHLPCAEILRSREFLNLLAVALPEEPSADAAEWLLRSYLLCDWLVWKPTEQVETHKALANSMMTGKGTS